MKNNKTDLLVPSNRAIFCHNKRTEILQHILQSKAQFFDIAGTQYAGYYIDKILSFLDVRAEPYSVECTDVLHEDTYLEATD